MESIGVCAPVAKKITLVDTELNWLCWEGKRLAKFRGYYKHVNEWKRGLSDRSFTMFGENLVGPPFHFMSGYVGTYCYCRILGVPLNTKLMRDGDGGFDIEISGHRLEVKTRNYFSSTNLIRCIYDNGVHVVFKSEAFAFAQWDTKRTVWLMGWIPLRDVLHERDPKPAKKGKHQNYEVLDRELRSLNSLIQEASLWREECCVH